MPKNAFRNDPPTTEPKWFLIILENVKQKPFSLCYKYHWVALPDMIKLTKFNDFLTWILQELQSPNELNYVKYLPYKIWIKFQINVTLMGSGIAVTDVRKMLK